MTDSLRQKTWRFICKNFPERQIYIRSEGRVQFFSFGPMMQAILAGTGLLALGWVAFTSVNTIFKDRIMAVKESHYRQQVASNESRIANLQQAYDDLNQSLLAAEDKFKSVADDVESRHRTLAGLVERKDSLHASLGLDPADLAVPKKITNSGARSDADAGMGGSLDLPVPSSAATLAPASAVGQGAVPGSSALAQPHKVQSGSALTRPHAALSGAAKKLGALFASPHAVPAANRSAFHNIEVAQARLERVNSEENALLGETETAIESETVQYQKTIRTAGIDPKNIIARVVKSRGGMGGPEIALPLSAARNEATSFGDHALLAMASLDELTNVVTALRAVPLGPPVHGDEFEQSSGFGVRRDPFDNSISFHSGLDFSGPLGAPVRATAPGIVVFAGVQGAYGNTVEVDHGFGIRTRYGHLSRITVQVGAQVQKGAIIGKLGSTGRSTGPHVHYEVWYDTAVKNPSNFLKAGRYVLQDQGT